jgi:hypothetical protein
VQTLEEVVVRSQDGHQFDDEISLTRADRRLLLGASLRLICHRFLHGQPIFQDDVIRIATFADDAERAA